MIPNNYCICTTSLHECWIIYKTTLRVVDLGVFTNKLVDITCSRLLFLFDVDLVISAPNEPSFRDNEDVRENAGSIYILYGHKDFCSDPTRWFQVNLSHIIARFQQLPKSTCLQILYLLVLFILLLYNSRTTTIRVYMSHVYFLIEIIWSGASHVRFWRRASAAGVREQALRARFRRCGRDGGRGRQRVRGPGGGHGLGPRECALRAAAHNARRAGLRPRAFRERALHVGHAVRRRARRPDADRVPIGLVSRARRERVVTGPERPLVRPPRPTVPRI